MNKLFFICLLGLLCARQGSILTIDDKDYSLQQFYAQYPKKQWAKADSTQREKMYMDFIKREKQMQFGPETVSTDERNNLRKRAMDNRKLFKTNFSWRHGPISPD